MQIIRLKSKADFINRMSDVAEIKDDVVLVCMDGLLVEDEVIEKLKEILFSNEHHAVIAPVFFKKLKNYSNNLDFFDIVPFVSPNFFMLKMSILKNSGGLNLKMTDMDLCLAEYCARINSYGYSTIQANFSVSAEKDLVKLVGLAQKEMLSISEKLNKRYPTLKSVVKNYISFKEDPIIHFKNILEGASGVKPRLLFSFQNLMASYNGTAEYSFALLSSFVKLYHETYDIDVIIHKAPWSFHRKNFPKQVSVYYFNQDENKLPLYDMIFSSSQIWEMKYLYLFNRLSPRIVVAILDAIVWRSGHLDVFHAGGHTAIINRLILRYCDGFLAISDTARQDILSFFHNTDTHNLFTTSTLLGHDFRFKEEDNTQKKMLVGMYSKEIRKILSKKYIIIFGNGLKHKSIREAHDHLLDVDIHRVYIGLDGGKFKNESQASFFHSGGIPDSLMQELFKNAHLLIFPSQYEGFGLPIIKAVEYGKKIILFNNEINREVVGEFVKNDGQAIFFDFFFQLAETVNMNSGKYSFKKTEMRTWDEVAFDTEVFFQKILQSDIDPNRLRDRWFNLKLMELENNNYLSLQKMTGWAKDFGVHATVIKKKFFPKKLF